MPGPYYYAQDKLVESTPVPLKASFWLSPKIHTRINARAGLKQNLMSCRKANHYNAKVYACGKFAIIEN
jgi:hypothetical protein